MIDIGILLWKSGKCDMQYARIDHGTYNFMADLHGSYDFEYNASAAQWGQMH